MKQLNLFISKTKSEFGGSLLKGKRKSARPLGIKKSNHLVLKTKNSILLFKNSKLIGPALIKYGRRFGIHIYSYAIHADHIHISFKIQNREAYKKWIRAVTSVLVGKIAGLKFSLRPWSRIVSWGRAFKTVQAYIQINQVEVNFIVDAIQTVEKFARRMRLGVVLR